MSRKLFTGFGDRVEVATFLRGIGFPQERLEHSLRAADLGLRISGLMAEDGVEVSRPVVENGALLHDAGYLRVRGAPVVIMGWERSGITVPEDDINHPVLGALLAREWGFGEAVVDCVLRHNIGGFTVEECVMLGVEPTPWKDCTPTTIEEKVVRYADHLLLLERLGMDPFSDPQASARACLPWLNHYFTSKVGRRLEVDDPVVQREVALSAELAEYGRRALSSLKGPPGPSGDGGLG
ncbi:MAG: HD domain-containing protein [Candidatus Bathyarchaeia archaeon]